jgi:hypothetical protein
MLLCLYRHPRAQVLVYILLDRARRRDSGRSCPPRERPGNWRLGAFNTADLDVSKYQRHKCPVADASEFFHILLESVARKCFIRVGKRRADCPLPGVRRGRAADQSRFDVYARNGGGDHRVFPGTYHAGPLTAAVGHLRGNRSLSVRPAATCWAVWCRAYVVALSGPATLELPFNWLTCIVYILCFFYQSGCANVRWHKQRLPGNACVSRAYSVAPV